MKILCVIESLGRGGAEQMLVNLLPVLRARGHACEVAALLPPYDLGPELERAGITVHRLNMNHRLNLVQGVSRIASLCRRGNFDVVHAQLFLAEVLTAMSRPLAPSPRRVVLFQSPDYDFYPVKNPIKRMRKAFHKWLVRHCIDGCVGASCDVARNFEDHFKLPRVAVIHNALPADIVRPVENFDAIAVRTQYCLPPHGFLLITPARLTAQKGHRFLLGALGILRGKGLYPKALMIGQGPLMKQIADQAAKMGLQEQAIVRPAVAHQDLMRLIQAADALVLPSLYEGFGLAAGEGMALERPVIVSCVGGLMEVVEDGVSGLHVPPGDPVALAQAIARLMNEPELCIRLGRAGRERVLTKFNIDVIAEQWEEFFENLLQNRAH